MSGVVAKKGFFRKTNSAGQKVMRDRTKAGLWGLGGLALFTPFGGNLISGLTGQAAENTSKTIGSIGDGAAMGMTQAPISALCCSCSSCIVLIVVAMIFLGRR
jgi:hypothetical protein